MILLSPTCLANEIDNGPVLFALLEMIQCQCHGFMSPQPTGEEHVDLWAGIFKGSRMAAKVRGGSIPITSLLTSIPTFPASENPHAEAKTKATT
jgi:hypothetical protein